MGRQTSKGCAAGAGAAGPNSSPSPHTYNLSRTTNQQALFVYASVDEAVMTMPLMCISEMNNFIHLEVNHYHTADGKHVLEKRLFRFTYNIGCGDDGSCEQPPT